jgi:hypothetical protein
MKNKDLNIEYLYSTIVFILLLGILLISHATGKIDKGKLIAGIILLLVLLLTYFYILYKRSLQIPSFIKTALVDMGDFSGSLLKKTFTNPYTCPANCPVIVTDEENPPSSSSIGSKINIAPTLNTDPQNNVWKDGDNQLIQPLRGKGLTYYECKWLGGKIDGNSLPIQDKDKYSTIPCTYKSNYTQVNKLICNDDPNKNGIENCNKF